MSPEVPETAGRGAELRLLGEALDELALGRGGCLWIEGEAGIGKTHLVGVLCALAAGRGHAVRVGHADELMRGFPLRAAADVLDIAGWSADPARSAIAGLIGGVPAGTPIGTSAGTSGGASGGTSAGTAAGTSAEVPAHVDPVLAAAGRMVELVDRMCADAPTVFVLEDAHWSDGASLALVERLGRVARRAPLLLVVTSRPAGTEPDPPWAAVRARAGRRLSLSPLTPAEVAAFARTRLLSDPGPRLCGLLAAAEGNPLYLSEILAPLGHGDLAVTDNGCVELAGTEPLPDRLAGALDRRLGTLAPEHRQALRAAALLGERFGVEDFGLVLGRDPGPVLDASAAAGLLVLDGGIDSVGDRGRARFRHELVRQALVGQLSPAIRGGMHDHIARTLAAAHRPDTVVAGHLAAAGDPPAGWAREWLVTRAEPTLYTAPDAYSALLARAVPASDHPPQRAGLLCRLMLVSFWLGHDDTVASIGPEALAGLEADRDLAARLRILMLRSLARQRRFTEALSAVAPTVHDPRASDVWRARALAWAAAVEAFAADPDQARETGYRALALATEAADPLGIAAAHSALAPVDGADRMIGHLQAGVDVLGDDPDSLDLRLQMAGNLAARLGTEGDPRAEAVLRAAIATAEQVGTYRTCALHAHAAGHFFEHGAWDEALPHIERWESSAARHPAFAYLLGIRAVIAYRRGAFDEGARVLLDAGVPEPAPDETPVVAGPFLIQAAALRAEAAGRPEQALRIRSQYLELPNTAQRDSRSAEALYLIRLARQLGDEATALAALETVRAVASAPPSRDARLTIAACEAVVAADAARLLEVAEDFLAGCWPVHGAYAFEEAAAVLALAGDPAAARTPFLRATDIYDDAGLAWDLRRATARFRVYGIRRAPKTRARGARAGWSSLTETELRVAELVARGHTNADIARELLVSRNTVQSHVSRILGKLGQRSRAELAREVALRGDGVLREP